MLYRDPASQHSVARVWGVLTIPYQGWTAAPEDPGQPAEGQTWLPCNPMIPLHPHCCKWLPSTPSGPSDFLVSRQLLLRLHADLSCRGVIQPPGVHPRRLQCPEHSFRAGPLLCQSLMLTSGLTEIIMGNNLSYIHTRPVLAAWSQRKAFSQGRRDAVPLSPGRMWGVAAGEGEEAEPASFCRQEGYLGQ